MMLLRRNHYATAALVACVCLNVTCRVQAAHSISEVRVTVDRQNIVAGEQIHLSVAITATVDAVIRSQGAADSLAGFLVLSTDRDSATTLPNSKTTHFSYTLLSTAPGVQELPALTFKASSPHKKQLLTTKPIPVSVGLLPVDVSLPYQKIYPSTPIAYTPRELLPYLLALAVMLLALLGFCFRNHIRRWQAAIERHLYYRRTLRSIDRMATAEDMTVRLPQVLRAHISTLFHVETSCATSSEIVKVLEKKNLNKNLIQTLEWVLSETDKAKFTRTPRTLDKRELVRISQEVIRLTKTLSC